MNTLYFNLKTGNNTSTTVLTSTSSSLIIPRKGEYINIMGMEFKVIKIVYDYNVTNSVHVSILVENIDK